MNLDLDRAALLCGDCLVKLRVIPDATFDAVVTDPPYELGFMGKTWDASGIAYSVELWREVLRVLKPGGHLLSFGGTRTYHRMACAIEDAGFEIRDSLHWMYGTGFPKSLNVSKALDAAAGAEREETPTVAMQPKGDVGEISKNKRCAVCGKARASGNPCVCPRLEDIAVTEAAKQWEGWGTALKPGHEPIVLARKPLEGTVAANVQKWGTGGLNIDGCRIGTETRTVEPTGTRIDRCEGRDPEKFAAWQAKQQPKEVNGRWPANVLLDEDAAAELDAQSGISKSTGGSRGAGGQNGKLSPIGAQPDFVPGKGDTGGASRFFYVAKPSRKERDLGCDHLTPKSGGEATDREDDSKGVDNPRAGAGRTGGAKNYHPTVKPIELMRYLVRLVTPPGGLVLDPFAGSGTTGMAALFEGFRFVGVEASEEYFPITCARITKAHADSHRIDSTEAA